MESSAVVAFRALIMVACLVLVPLAAIFGSAFPDVVKANLVDRFWPGHKQTQLAHDSTGEAPRFGDSSSLNQNPTASSLSAGHEAAAAWPPHAGNSPSAVRAVGSERGGEIARATPARFSAPAESSPPAWPPADTAHSAGQAAGGLDARLQTASTERPAPARRLASGSPLASSERLAPAESQSPAGRAAFQGTTSNPANENLPVRQGPIGRQPAEDRPSAYARVIDNPLAADAGNLREAPTARPAAVQSADFKSTERRLRQYGAAYYRLETVGKDGLEYRFFCLMPTSGGVQNPRHFEAVDSDPLSAMTRVADDVQTWLGRQ